MPSKNEIIIRLAGEGGEGVISTGDIFTLGSARSGYNVFTFRTYPAEIKGGHAWYHIRVGSSSIRSMGDGVDVLVAFNAEAYHIHHHLLNPGGVLIYDPDTVTPENSDAIQYPIPFNRIARKDLEFVRGKNVVVTGFLAGLFGLEPASLEDLIRNRFKRRPEILDKNMKALETGVAYATKEITKSDPFYLSETNKVGRLVMSGNDAISAGALYAGCRYYAGYPITPASEILETMARELPRLGGISLQAEDEIASIASCIGASFSGVKAMTATSGPGFSLMTEFMGYAGMAEIPLVLIDAQRAGPSTGMPTKLEQGDLNHSLYGGHGDFPRIVIAPGDVKDCFHQIVNAFNMAERYQTICVFLSDQSLSHRTETLTKPDVSTIPVIDREKPTDGDLEGYLRYLNTETGISPMSIPGMKGGAYTSAGLEHDEAGHVDKPMESHLMMVPKRYRKIETARREMEKPNRYGVVDATIGLIGWGSTQGVIEEAVDRVNANGIKAAAMHPKVLCPLPDEELQAFIDSVDYVLVPEVNYSGQFAHYLQANLNVKPVRLNKYDGLPFTPGEIVAKIEEVASHG